LFLGTWPGIWLLSLIIYSVWMFSRGFDIDQMCFLPDQHWPWWFWRDYATWIGAPWALSAAACLAIWLSRRFG